jgi:hypothetical protein
VSTVAGNRGSNGGRSAPAFTLQLTFRLFGLVLILLAIGGGTVARAQDDSVETESPTATVAVTAAEVQDEPVSPSPTPTVIPTAVPTEVVPVPTATAIVETSPQVDEPSSAADEGLRSADMGEADGQFSANEVVGIASVSGGGCTQVSPSDVVDVPNSVEFLCNGATFPGQGQGFERRYSAPTEGWEYQINNDGSWRAGSHTTSFGNNAPAVTVLLRPTTSVTVGTSGSVTVTLVRTPSNQTEYQATLSATRGPLAPTAADFAFTRSVGDAAQQVTCTWSGLASLGTRQVTLTQIVVPAPAGWIISSNIGTVSGTTLTITPNVTVGHPSPSYSFSFSLVPTCTASTTTQTMNLTSQFSFGATSNITGPSATVSATRQAGTLAVGITSSNINFGTLGYSFNPYPINPGSLNYSVNASVCSGWNVQVSATNFVYSGLYGGANIPANPNFTLTGVTNPGGPGITTPTTAGVLGSPLKVLSASAAQGIGTFQQTLNVNLAVPGGSLAGTYTSKVTIEVSSGP